MTNELKLLSIAEAATFLHLKVSTLYAWVHGRKIPHRKHGSKLVFALDDLIEWSNARCVSVLHGEVFAECVTKGAASQEAGSLITRRTVENP
jgi:excisionase family DNA binding protein